MATNLSASGLRYPLPVFLISVVLLALQVTLMQLLAYTQGHHLAYIVLSIALLGFGSGGSVLTLIRGRDSAVLEKGFTPALLLCAVTTAALPLLARPLLGGLEVDLLQVEPRQWLRVLGLGAVFFPPFFWGATALSIAFSVQTERIHLLYAANLFGSALGSGVAWLALFYLQPEQLVAPLALLMVLTVVLNRPPFYQWGLAAALVAGALLFTPEIPRSPYKALSYALQLPDVDHQGPIPHPLGRVDRVTSPALRHAPDLSLVYGGPVPAPPRLFVDGETAAVLLRPEDPAARILLETPQALPFVAGNPERILFLSPGGTAPLLASGGARLTAVEHHPQVSRALGSVLESLPLVMVRQDPRLFLARRAIPPQDLIVFPERGQFGGPSGLQTLGEDTLFTVEALQSAFRLLSPTGRLAFTVWLDHPLRHAPRLVDLIAVGLRDAGFDAPGDHVVAVRGWGSLSILVSPRPFSESELASVVLFCRDKGFDTLWPLSREERLHGDATEALDALIAGLLGPQASSVRARYRFDIRAPTDDQPFFNQFLHPGDRGRDLDALSLSERGPVVLRALFLLLAAAVVLLVLGPLIPLRRDVTGSPFTLLTFSGLGAGFMLFEVALIQRLTLLWGHPVVSAVVVMTTLLCGMGIGSAWSRRLDACSRTLLPLLVGIAAIQVLLYAGLPAIVTALMGMSPAIRYGVGGGGLVLVAIPMGMPFPLCLRMLGAQSRRHVPWACGIDSSLAVLTGPVAALIAIRSGYASLSLLAGAAYLLAVVGVMSWRQRL